MVFAVQWDGVVVSRVQVECTPRACLLASLIHSSDYSGVCRCGDSVALRMPCLALANKKLITLLNSFGCYNEGYTDLHKVTAVMN